jgi:hypothetical protein
MREIPLDKGFHAIVDDEDYEEVSKYHWWENSGYAVRKIKTPSGWKVIRMHRWLMGLQTGDRREVDHINGNKLDNRRSTNLRICTHAENMKNYGRPASNTSGFKGVNFEPRWNRWRARIKVNGKRIFLGEFSTPEAAHEAYKQAAEKHHGEFSNPGNFEKAREAA